MATPEMNVYEGYPMLAVFKDWYVWNPKTLEAYGLLDHTFSQALCWVVNHMDLSLEWQVTDSEELK